MLSVLGGGPLITTLKPRTSIAIAALCCLWSLSACGDATGADGATGHTAPSSKSDQAETWEAEIDLPDVTGTYRFALESEAVFRALDDGEETTVQTRISALVDLVATGSEVSWTFSPCEVILPEIDGRQPSIETAVIRSLAPVSVSSAWEPGETEPQLRTNTAVWVVGASLEDPATDALPTDGDDPRVVDVDRDGKPGVSLYVDSFRLYASLRFSLSVTVRYQEDGSLVGDADLTLEIQLYGDDIPFYNAVTAVEEALESLELVEQVHQVSLLGVDPESSDCDPPQPEPIP